MKQASIFLATALVIAGVAACEKKEPAPNETNITSAPVQADQPVETTGGAGSWNGTSDPGAPNAAQPSGVSGSMEASGTTTGFTTGSNVEKGRDGGVNNSGVPSPIHEEPATTVKGSSRGNKTTTLGDGTSGTYSDKGSYGGKATHGTGDKDNGTLKDKTPAPEEKR